jgi:hypothetical protein
MENSSINGSISGLYIFLCSCSFKMGVAMFDRPPGDVDSGKWPHHHRASWAIPVKNGKDDIKRPVIMCIKPEYRSEDAIETSPGRFWDRRGF